LTVSDTTRLRAIATLRDGRRLEIRPYRPEDRDEFSAAVKRLSPASLYRRFFTPKRSFSEREKDFFLNIDFDRHVAVVAVVTEAGRNQMVGSARYIIVRPGTAEVAFGVIDDYQGLGIGAALMRHLIGMARGAGLQFLVAEVLPENRAMLTIFERCGLRMTTKREAGIVHVEMRLT
jgi:RimJ/RimL family protein N-acetyltransferase